MRSYTLDLWKKILTISSLEYCEMIVNTIIEYEDMVEKGVEFNTLEDNSAVVTYKLFAQIMEKVKMMVKYYEQELGKK